MLRKTNLFIFFIAVIVFSGTLLLSLISSPGVEGGIVPIAQRAVQGTSNKESPFDIPKDGIYTYIGKSESQILKIFGKPERIDDTKYGYQWFIYGRNTDKYLQIGIDSKTRQATTIYALGNKLRTAPFVIGEQSKKIFESVKFSNKVSMNNQNAHIEFDLNAEDMMERPLVKFGSCWVQLSLDHVSGRLMGVRYMSSEVLALQHPYSMIYTGSLPPAPVLSGQQWQKVNSSEDLEIFDMSNILRTRFKKSPLIWSPQAHQAAYLHSREMKVKNYFSHDSPWSGDLKTRLDKEKILFLSAGENIAARYPDAASVTIGWLNSIDHRENLLNGNFTELGVGSYQNDYTQDFVQPMNK